MLNLRRKKQWQIARHVAEQGYAISVRVTATLSRISYLLVLQNAKYATARASALYAREKGKDNEKNSFFRKKREGYRIR